MFFQKQKDSFCKIFHYAASLKNGQFFRSTILLIALLSFSCSDQGCIEADDFGEYDTQTIEVLANSSADSCVFDYTKEMTDASQGSGIKTCLISGNVTIYDENNVSQTSSSGCNGLPGASFKNLCIDQCVSNCNANIGSIGGLTAEPSWIATTKKTDGRNGGVNLKPNSEISIRAIGNVNLGDRFTYPPFYVSADDFMPQAKKVDWSNQRLDIGQGKSVSIYFSGKFNDGSVKNGGSTTIGQIGAGSSTVLDDKVYNAARRLVAYMIEHPAGYDFDQSTADEKVGSRGVPLLADANLWQCTYSPSGSNIETQSVCNNKSYSANGYPNVDDLSVNGIFPITSDSKSDGLGNYGGMIRWTGDNLIKDNFDPFSNAGVNCDNPACTGASSVQSGRIVGDISSDLTIDAPTKASKVSFKFLISGTTCNAPYDIYVRSSSGTDLYSYEALTISNTNWNNTKLNALNQPVAMHIAIEPGQKLVIKQSSRTYTSISGNATNCGRALAIKYAPYHDIEIKKSGLVTFAMLNGTSVSGCTIKGRIINPSGRHKDSDATADFYEYANFNQPVNNGDDHDPLENLAVPATTLLSNFDAVTGNMPKIFVRKGQKIRFSPESWNGTWNAVGGARDCGIGMAMRIIPRPALLCRGYADDNVLNPGCTMKFISNNLVGCDEIASQCNDSASDAYCPNQQCIKAVTCTDGNLSNNYTRSNCTLASSPPAGASASTTCNTTAYTLDKCNRCSELRRGNAETPAYLTKSTMAQCYDLEDYKGKVANIPNNGVAADVATFLTGSTSTNCATTNSKCARKLDSFNGTYGSFKDFSNSGKVDNANSNNVIYQTAQPINLIKPGRIKFMLLDGDSFLKIDDDYSNNTDKGAAYNGVNGLKIETSSMLEFSNGEWLEAILCKETSDSSVLCRSDSVPTQISGQSPVIRLADPVSGSFNPQTTTAFKLDGYGSLVRFQPRTNFDCTNALVGDNYYCHTDTVDNLELIKLSFKIKDPEPPNCNTSTPTSTDATTFNGIIITNTRYRPNDCNTSDPDNSNPTVKNGVFSSTNNGDGTYSRTCVASNNAGAFCTSSDNSDCAKQFRCVNKYSNNSGKYYVTVRVKTQGANISAIVNDVITPVVEVMDGSKDGTKIGQAERIYKLIIGDPRYQALLSMSLILMYTFYGIGYLMGITEAGLKDMTMKVVKISIIYFFVSPQGWEWFDTFAVKLFKNSTDYLAFLMASSFDDSPALQNAINNFDFYDKSILFGSVDKVFGIFFSQTVQKKISALLFASIFGWAYLLIIYYGILLYVYAVANAVLLYLTSQVFISILFVLGPIFFIFTLFNQTKDMFDKWLTQLIGFSLQQIFLLTTLAFFNMMMYEVIKLALGYKICWDEVWTINIIIRITLMSFWTIASLPPRTSAQTDAGNIGNPDGIPSLFSILFIWVIAGLMLEFITFMTNLASSIAGGLKASELGAGVKGVANSIRGFAGKRMDELWKKTGGYAVERLDQALFDSGERADKVRDARKRQLATDLTNRKKLTDASNQAMSDYKKKHGAEYAGLDKEGQEKKLREIKDKAIADMGAKLGLSESDIKRLKSESGLKYVGENVFGAAYKAAKQGAKDGGALFTSIDKKGVDTRFSSKEFKSALKNKNNDAQGRKKLLDAAKDGKVNIGSGRKFSETAVGKIAHDAATALPFMNSKEYNEARDQLKSVGEIDDMAKGLGWALSDVDKMKINERMESNKKESEAKKPQFSSASEIAKFEKFAEEQNIKADGKGKPTKKGESRASLAANIRKERGQKIAENIASQLASAKKAEQDAKKDYDSHEATIEDLMSGGSYDEINALESSGDPDKMQMARQHKDYDDYVSRSKELKATFAKRGNAEAKQKNYAKQVSQLTASQKTIQAATDIYDVAERSNNAAVVDQYNQIMDNFGDNSMNSLQSFVDNNPLTTEQRSDLDSYRRSQLKDDSDA